MPHSLAPYSFPIEHSFPPLTNKNIGSLKAPRPGHVVGRPQFYHVSRGKPRAHHLWPSAMDILICTPQGAAALNDARKQERGSRTTGDGNVTARPQLVRGSGQLPSIGVFLNVGTCRRLSGQVCCNQVPTIIYFPHGPEGPAKWGLIIIVWRPQPWQPQRGELIWPLCYPGSQAHMSFIIAQRARSSRG